MSWLFSQALVAGYLEGDCSDGEPYAPLSGSPTPQAYLLPVKTTESWRRFPSGMTYKPLTENRGQAVLTWFLEGFPVKTYQVQEKELESTESDQACGHTWRASLAKYDPASRLWKTAQCSLIADSNESLLTWPRSGMTAAGECWEQPMLGPTTSATGSGWWPTPTASDTANRQLPKHVYVTKTGLLAMKNAQGGKSQIKLSQVVKKWPTPTCNDAKNSTLPPSQINRDSLAGSLLTMGISAGGQLNPAWVEWLMGWPIGWTELKPLGMDKFQEWRRKHGIN